MNRSRLVPVRATAATGAAGGKKPPMGRQLSLMPDQSTPWNHQEVVTRPSFPVMNRSRLVPVRATAAVRNSWVTGVVRAPAGTGAAGGKKPPMGRQLSLMPDQSTPWNHQEV